MWFKTLSEEEKKKHIHELWHKARIEVDKIRFKTRLIKLKESSVKQQINEDAYEDEEDGDNDDQ